MLRASLFFLVTGRLWGEPLVTGGFPSQRASNTKQTYHSNKMIENNFNDILLNDNTSSTTKPIRSIEKHWQHYGDVIMGAITSQITSLTVIYSTVYTDADQRKHQSSASLAFVWGIHRGPVNSPHKWPVTRKVFPFDDVIMLEPRVPRVSLKCAQFQNIDYCHARCQSAAFSVIQWQKSRSIPK